MYDTDNEDNINYSMEKGERAIYFLKKVKKELTEVEEAKRKMESADSNYKFAQRMQKEGPSILEQLIYVFINLFLGSIFVACVIMVCQMIPAIKNMGEVEAYLYPMLFGMIVYLLIARSRAKSKKEDEKAALARRKNEYETAKNEHALKTEALCKYEEYLPERFRNMKSLDYMIGYLQKHTDITLADLEDKIDMSKL